MHGAHYISVPFFKRTEGCAAKRCITVTHRFTVKASNNKMALYVVLYLTQKNAGGVSYHQVISCRSSTTSMHKDKRVSCHDKPSTTAIKLVERSIDKHENR